MVEQCIKETLKHKENVGKEIGKVISELNNRIIEHDNSKIEDPELPIFVEYTPKLKNTTYGSDEYKQYLAEMNVALKHHYGTNRHHPEHFKKYVCNGCFKEFQIKPQICDACGYTQFQEESDMSQMNLIDLVEMFCDWLAATKRHADGDITRSTELNKTRFKYSDDLAAIFRNTAAYLK